MAYPLYETINNEIKKLNEQKIYLEEFVNIKIYDLNYPTTLYRKISIRRLDNVIELKRLFYNKAKEQGIHFSYTGFLSHSERMKIANKRGEPLSASIPEFNEDYSKIVFRKSSPLSKEEYLKNAEYINDVLPNGGTIYVLSHTGSKIINII